jgi:hypothetical protein
MVTHNENMCWLKLKNAFRCKNGRQKYDFEFFQTTPKREFAKVGFSSKVINSTSAR